MNKQYEAGKSLMTSLSGLLSGGCTYDDGTKEWKLYQLDTSFSAMIFKTEWVAQMLLGTIVTEKC